ncbi:MAG: hypothetical protein KGV46_03210 [Pasteurella sp.]|nr:hypothetical protein [Pasteurella sp.]
MDRYTHIIIEWKMFKEALEYLNKHFVRLESRVEELGEIVSWLNKLEESIKGTSNSLQIIFKMLRVKYNQFRDSYQDSRKIISIVNDNMYFDSCRAVSKEELVSIRESIYKETLINDEILHLLGSLKNEGINSERIECFESVGCEISDIYQYNLQLLNKMDGMFRRI